MAPALYIGATNNKLLHLPRFLAAAKVAPKKFTEKFVGLINLSVPQGKAIRNRSLKFAFHGANCALGVLAKKLEKPLLHIYDAPKERISNPNSLCLEVQALTDFLRSNKIEVLNVAGPRESKEPGVYELTLIILRFSLNRAASAGGHRST
jgi:hypothetical protein